MGVLELLLACFVAAKLFGAITVSWWAIAAVYFGAYAAFFAVIGVIAGITFYLDEGWGR